MFIDHAAVVYQSYGIPPFVIGGLFALALMVMIFRRIGVAAYTFPALILITIFGLIFVPQEIFSQITAGQGSDEARARIAEIQAIAPARFIATPVLGLTALIFLRGNFMIPVLLLTVGMAYIVEAQFNPNGIANLGLPVVNVPDIDLLNLGSIQLGGGASGLKEGVSGLAGSIPLGN
jgi:hypothetical protein